MSSSSSKSSLDSGRRDPATGPGIGGNGGTVSGAPGGGVAGRVTGGAAAAAWAGADAVQFCRDYADSIVSIHLKDIDPVVLKEGESATEDEIIAYCREQLAAYKVPTIIEFRDDLPKSMVGKVLRRELRETE